MVSVTSHRPLCPKMVEVIFAVDVAKKGDQRWNCHGAGPCIIMIVTRPALTWFADALAAELRARVPDHPCDLLFDAWDNEPGLS